MSFLPILTPAELFDAAVKALPPLWADRWVGANGEAILRAMGKAGARVAERVAEWSNGRYILQATGPLRATGTVTVTAVDGTTEPIGLRSGQPIMATEWGIQYRLSADLVFPAASPPATDAVATVEAVNIGWHANQLAEHVDVVSLASGVDPAANILWTPETTEAGKTELLAGILDESFTFTAMDMTGGSVGTLNLIGSGRGLPRAEGETDADFRRRIRRIPVTVTPNAIVAALNEIVELATGGTVTLKEPWDFGFVVGHPVNGAIGVSPFARPLSFVVCVPEVAYTGKGWAVGDPVNGAIGVSPIGLSDTVAAGFYAGLQVTLDRLRAGGIWGQIVRTGEAA